MSIWKELTEWIRRAFAPLTKVSTVSYIGIATVQGPAEFQAPVYRRPRARGQVLGYVKSGQYVPHFTATPDLGWLEVTLPSGDKGWLENRPEQVTVTLPDPQLITICVDPGHGGSDTGAVGNGLVEKDLNFDIAYWHLGPRLQNDSRVHRVWFTRTGDDSVSLAFRSDLANAAGATLFVSVHNNAYLSTSRGTETYYKCGSEAAPDVAAPSRRAACLTHNRLKEAIEAWASPSCPWVDRGVICRLGSQSDLRSYYYVLRNTFGPAILVECLFVSNPQEATCLGNHDFRDRMAHAIYVGIVDTLFTSLPGTSCNFRTYYGL